VVRYGRLTYKPDGGAIAAEGFSPEAAKALSYPATATEPFSHPTP